MDLLAQSCTATATNPISVSNYSFITPRKLISSRRVAPTFCSNLPQFSFTSSHPERVQPKPILKPFPSPQPQSPQPSPTPATFHKTAGEGEIDDECCFIVLMMKLFYFIFIILCFDLCDFFSCKIAC